MSDYPEESDSLFSGRVSDSKIHLTVGAPGDSLLSRLPAVLQSATNHCMSSQTSAQLLQYGPEAGTVQYRTQLARFLSTRYGDTVDSGSLVLTTGATNGLHLVTSSLLSKDATVFVENPTYFIAQNIIANDMGLNIVPVDMTQDGIDLEELETQVRNQDRSSHEPKDGRYWGMIYTIPTYHNPTGVTMKKSVAQDLIKLARKYNLLIFCDDVYNLLSYNKLEYSRLKSLDDQEDCVISNGTFSKIFAPGARLGWLECPPHLVQKLKQSGVLVSGGSQNNVMSGLMTSMIQLGLLEENLLHCIKIYGDRMAAVAKVLKDNLPSKWSFSNPGGGYFLWIVTDVDDLTPFIQWLQDNKNLVVMSGQLAASKKDCFKNCFRISIAYYEEHILTDSCLTICNSAKQYFNMM